MKRLLLFIFLGCSLLQAKAQKLVVTPYILGLVDDHQGRSWVKDDPVESTVVGKFHSTEALLVSYIDSLIKAENVYIYRKVSFSIEKWDKKDCFYCKEFRRIHSQRLVQLMNEAYEFTWTKEVNEKQHKIFNGVLKPKYFEKELEKYSFLAGAFVRYGTRENGQYTYKLINSKSKFEAIKRELKFLKMEILDVKVESGENGNQLITFVPNRALKAYLNRQERVRVDILRRKETFNKQRQQEQKPLDLFTSS